MEEFKLETYEAFPEDMTDAFDGGEQTILQTWLIDDGFAFDQIPETIEFAGYRAHLLENQLYLIATGWSSEATCELLNKIGKNQLIIQTVVIFPYNFDYVTLSELKTNLKTAFEENKQINIRERY